MYSQPIKNEGKAISAALKLNLLLTALYKTISKAKNKLFTRTEAPTPNQDAFFTHQIVKKLKPAKNKKDVMNTDRILYSLLDEILSSIRNKGTNPIMAPGKKSKGGKLEANKIAPKKSIPMFLIHFK